MRVLIVGCGYVGRALAKELGAAGHEVFALRRTEAPEPAGSGRAVARWLTADVTRKETLASLTLPFDWVVNMVSTRGGDAEEYRKTYLAGTENLLSWLEAAPPKKYVYTSSTSVYAQDDGSVVTEESVAAPESATARVLVETEQLALERTARLGISASILRVAGIYGPGRGYWLKQFLAGEAVLRAGGDRVLNMIHRDDVAGAVHAALRISGAQGIYNAVDDEPVRQTELFGWLSARLNRPLPAHGPAMPLAGRALTNKRVSNAKLKRELGYQFKYPTFREGYATLLEREG